MPGRITFDLTIVPQENEACFFYLVWDDGNRNLPVSQPIPARLQRDYETWKRQYLNLYELPVDQTVPPSGSLSILPIGDLSAAVRNAEDAMMDTFLNWLGAGKAREIERQLQTALIEAQSSNTEASESVGVDVFLDCSDRFLQQLPWEAWVHKLVPKTLPVGSIRLIRTSSSNQKAVDHSLDKGPPKKPRILAVIAEDESSSFDEDGEVARGLQAIEDWKILQVLQSHSVAEVKRARWEPTDAPDVVAQKVFEAISDDRGWDILFFAGHSDDRVNNSGSFQLTPEVELSMNDIKEHLETAQQQGLRLAIFNSCSGLAIAQSLTQSGIQAIVMRERIRSDAALAFLKPLCQGLKEYQDAQTAMLQACEVLRSAEKIKFPSVHLVPSFFSPQRVLPYRIKPYGWRQQIRKWLPTKREMRAAGIVLLLGSVPAVNDALIEARVGLQAIYRDLTRQIPKIQEGSIPPVHVVAIDQNALDEKGITEARPMSQGLIADLVEAIAPYQPRTIGISYLLDDPDENSSRLIETMRRVSQEQKTWFIVAESAARNLEVFEQLRNSEVNLRGDSRFWLWDVDTPDDRDLEELCPFGYLMALAHNLNATSTPNELPVFRDQVRQEVVAQALDDNDFCRSVIALNDSLVSTDTTTTEFIRQNRSFYGWQSIIDFSLPEDVVYERTLASTLLKADELTSADSDIEPSDQVFIIGSGNYADAEDNHAPPLALRYWWCSSLYRTRNLDPGQNENQNCELRVRRFSGSEAHAYMVSQFLQQRQVGVVPNYLITGLFIVISKATVLSLQRQPQARRKRLIRYLFFAIAGYALLSFQLYVSIPVLLPILFPSTILLNYLGPISRRTL